MTIITTIVYNRTTHVVIQLYSILFIEFQTTSEEFVFITNRLSPKRYYSCWNAHNLRDRPSYTCKLCKYDYGSPYLYGRKTILFLATIPTHGVYFESFRRAIGKIVLRLRICICLKCVRMLDAKATHIRYDAIDWSSWINKFSTI